ncbi:MAG TPA: hypothetical protein VK515_10665, partial [Rhizomicrobium sp.]|nr:hypothetical protein [Rhizomicrobium sp.]
TNRIPSSGTYTGYICPSMDSGDYNTERNAHYYNGCWTSTKVTTGTTTVVVDKGSSSARCKGFASANCSCNSSNVCSTQKWIHTWVPNNHSTWGGCITDRLQDYDISNTTPVGSNTTGFPADNPANPLSTTNCMNGNVVPLEYDWSDLSSKVTAMQARGSTNQAVGVAHGWMALTQGNPYGAPALPANTTRYIILFSDGLNTQNRWWGDGSTEGTSDDDKIDDRMSAVCTAAKTDKVVIYTIYVHISSGEAATSAPLQDCASDSSKYYNLTSSAQIAAAFADITKQITNVRVSK